jgi:hypothetical protein
MEVDARRMQARMAEQSRLMRDRSSPALDRRQAFGDSRAYRPSSIGFFGRMVRLAVFGLIIVMFGPRVVDWLSHIDQAQISQSFEQLRGDIGRAWQQVERSGAGQRFTGFVSASFVSPTFVSHGISGGMNNLSQWAQHPAPPNLSMSDPRNPNGWTNMNSPNNPNGWTNMNSPNNPNGWTNMNSPNNPANFGH